LAVAFHRGVFSEFLGNLPSDGAICQ
jgi:hypothetical protein